MQSIHEGPSAWSAVPREGWRSEAKEGGTRLELEGLAQEEAIMAYSRNGGTKVAEDTGSSQNFGE
jgi:hypothetical protein